MRRIDGTAKAQLASYEGRLPATKSEQTAIAAILSDIDAGIATLQAKLAKHRSIKQGMDAGTADGEDPIDMTRQDETLPLTYGIELHQHRFAAWAACRAASVKGCRFSVEQGRAILEECGFTANFCRPEQLPEPHAVDEEHRRWRADVISAARSRELPFTHGVAAKLVNIYLKSRFVCGGRHAHERVHNLHPPIDSVLLGSLAEMNVGGNAKAWKQAAKTRWSKFGSEDYEQVIKLIRRSLKGDPLWRIEEHWRGYQ